MQGILTSRIALKKQIQRISFYIFLLLWQDDKKSGRYEIGHGSNKSDHLSCPMMPFEEPHFSYWLSLWYRLISIASVGRRAKNLGVEDPQIVWIHLPPEPTYAWPSAQSCLLSRNGLVSLALAIQTSMQGEWRETLKTTPPLGLEQIRLFASSWSMWRDLTKWFLTPAK